jgi:hypothetical protein
MKAINIVNIEFTDTHVMDYTTDGKLAIQVDNAQLLESGKDVPDMNEPGYVLLDSEGIAALRRMLANIPE